MSVQLGEGNGANSSIGDLDGSLREWLLLLVTGPKLAEALGITPRRLQQLANDGILLPGAA